MSIISGLFEGLIALGVIAVFFYMIWVRLAQKNPRMADKINILSKDKLYIRPEIPRVDEKIEQVWDERRKMM